jgi:hypothetical protein
VLDLHREDPALGREHRRVAEEARHRRGVDGGRHHHQTQARAPLAETPEEGQPQVGGQVALVELVQHHGADAVEPGVGEQAPGEHALGDEAHPGG